MSYIFLGVGNDGQDMWGTLKPPTVNEVCELSIWDPIKREYIRNKEPQATLRKEGTRPGLPAAHVERNGYVGPIPSESICEYFNKQQQKMKYFDTGERMVPGKPSKLVDVNNDDPIHPIPYPPAPFVFDGVTFVIRKGLSGSKYS